ncbi:uncharacterized protein LOC142420006 isoform X5 [Mycteria americana]|uniref:uncharacterized protein LOC142420006 isoform X5 n=1 Tax=Mycteria americana TaxID=33587 RepID=UPI003F581D0A
MHLRVPAGFPPAAARGASPRVRLRHSDRRMRSAPRPVAQQGGRRPPSAEVAGSSPAWASPEGAGDPRVCPGVPPPRRPASVATPGRAEPSGGAEPTPPVVWQHHRQPPSFLPSFLPAAVPGLGRGGGSHGGRRLSPLQHARPADQSLPVSRRCFGSPTVPSSPPVCPSSWASRMAPAAWPAPPPASPPCSCRTGCGASSRPPTPAGSSAPRLAATSPWGSPGTPTPPTSSTSTSSSADPPPVPADGDVPRWGR